MGIPAAVSFTCIGLALIGRAFSATRARRLSALLAVVVIAITDLSLTGYLYGAKSMYSLPPFTGIAMQTATMLFMLGIALLLSTPERQPIRVLIDPGAGGKLARRALPTVVLAPLALGWMRVWAQGAGLIDDAFGTAMGTLVEITMLIALVWWAAKMVRAHERVLHDRERTHALRARQLGALYEFTDRLHHAGSLQEVYDSALDSILNALGCQRASILLFDQSNVMRFVAWRGLSDGYRKAVEGHSPWKAGEANATPIGVGDIEQADLDHALKAVIRGEEIRSLAFIPLVADGGLIGKFMVYYPAPQDFTEAEFDLALTIARQLAFAVERQCTEEDLRENEERLRLATQTGKVGIWDWDIPANRVSWTDSLYAIHGVTREQFTGTVESFSTLVHPEDRLRVHQAIERSLAGRTNYEMEMRAVRPDGQIIWLFTSAMVLRVDGQPYRMIGATVDISGSKRAEAALREADRRKDEFLATLAHELRNPLAPITNAVVTPQK
jgi:PAS domain S-box-containing protein